LIGSPSENVQMVRIHTENTRHSNVWTAVSRTIINRLEIIRKPHYTRSVDKIELHDNDFEDVERVTKEDKLPSVYDTNVGAVGSETELVRNTELLDIAFKGKNGDVPARTLETRVIPSQAGTIYVTAGVQILARQIQ
jgi:hypothetical protein